MLLSYKLLYACAVCLCSLKLNVQKGYWHTCHFSNFFLSYILLNIINLIQKFISNYIFTYHLCPGTRITVLLKSHLPV